jgi:hypothetical protein
MSAASAQSDAARVVEHPDAKSFETFEDRRPPGQCTPDERGDQLTIARIIKRHLQKVILYRPAPSL